MEQKLLYILPDQHGSAKFSVHCFVFIGFFQYFFRLVILLSTLRLTGSDHPCGILKHFLEKTEGSVKIHDVLI